MNGLMVFNSLGEAIRNGFQVCGQVPGWLPRADAHRARLGDGNRARPALTYGSKAKTRFQSRLMLATIHPLAVA